MRNIGDRNYNDPENVMEVKTPAYVSDDLIETTFNLPTSRFSKYSRGILLVKGLL